MSTTALATAVCTAVVVALAAAPAWAGHAAAGPAHHHPAGTPPVAGQRVVAAPADSGAWLAESAAAGLGRVAGLAEGDAAHADTLSFEAATAGQPAAVTPAAPGPGTDAPAPGQALLLLALLALAAGLLRRTAPFNAGAGSRSSG